MLEGLHNILQALQVFIKFGDIKSVKKWALIFLIVKTSDFVRSNLFGPTRIPTHNTPKIHFKKEIEKYFKFERIRNFHICAY